MGISDEIKNNYNLVPHYHGDAVRRLFIFIGVILLIGLPFFRDLQPFPVILAILIITALSLFAGLTNPRQKWVAILDTSISSLGFIISEYLAVNYFNSELIFALTNQVVALLFFIALYYSTKTLRSFLLRD